jgi:glycosyltransferase involved in cell wall biosynthesis
VLKIVRGNYDWVVPVNGRLQPMIIRFGKIFGHYKVLITGHAGVGFEDRINIILGKPDVFVALTSRAERWANKMVLKSRQLKIVRIPNGVDIAAFSFQGKKPLPKRKYPTVLCVSALEEYKRVDRLIRAMEYVPASLIVVGDGPLHLSIEGLGKKVLNDRFELISRVDHRMMPEYYRKASIFTLPSRESEAFGLVYLEALASNRPIVAPDDENRRSIIGNAGLFCDVENADEYARTIRRALAKQWKNIPRLQAEKFSWDTITTSYDSVFRSFR